MTWQLMLVLAGVITTLTALWPELSLLGERLGWAVYREAMASTARSRQREAIHAFIVAGYVRSGDNHGLITYLGSGQAFSAAGQMVPVSQMRYPGPCLRHGWCGDFWCPQCDSPAYTGS